MTVISHNPNTAFRANPDSPTAATVKPMRVKKQLRYQMRIFLPAVLCLWAVVGAFAWTQYKHEKDYRRDIFNDRIFLALRSVLRAAEGHLDVRPFLRYVDSYTEDTPIDNMSIGVFDRSTGKLIHYTGEAPLRIPAEMMTMPYDTLSGGSKVLIANNVKVSNRRDPVYLYTSLISPKGTVEVRAFLPNSPSVQDVLKVNPWFWWTMLGVGVFGSVLFFILTAHQAKNIVLLHDFARRAASDRDFIPMGDFPSDELGDISRQIVAIYNSRMQANVRREREHVIALKATEEKNQVKRALTNNINHELKTPVGIIRGYIDMLVNQPDMPEQDREYFLGKVRDHVERMVTMLNDLSTMTRLEESGNNIPVTDVNFHDFVFSLAEDLESSGFLGDLHFTYNLPTDCHIRGNETLLQSVFTNLVKNAKAYSQATEIGIELVGRNEKLFTFSFYDNGVGVKEEHLTHLFERFYRVDSGRSRKAGSTGLGLPIVKSSINTLGGSITVRNRRGGGLEFIFTLLKMRPEDYKPQGGKSPDKTPDKSPDLDQA